MEDALPADPVNAPAIVEPAALKHASARFGTSVARPGSGRRGRMVRCRRSTVAATTTYVFDGVGCSVFLNNRYQDPTTGIFLSVDPLVASTGDPYLYAAGNPTTLSDPNGLCAVRSGMHSYDDGKGPCGGGGSHGSCAGKCGKPVKPAGPPTFTWLTKPSTCDDAGFPWLCRQLGFDDHSRGATVARSIAFGAMMSGGGESEVPPELAMAEAELDALVGRTDSFRESADVGSGRTAAGARLTFAGEGPAAELFASSGKAPRPGGVDIPTVRRFEATPGREFDAEVKLLENAANLLEQVEPGLREGTLNLFVDSPSLAICESCLGVVGQFNQLYPGIQVNIYVPIKISFG